MSSIGFDGGVEPAFCQHICIGRVRGQLFQCGMDDLELMYAYVYMYVYALRYTDLDIADDDDDDVHRDVDMGGLGSQESRAI